MRLAIVVALAACGSDAQPATVADYVGDFAYQAGSTAVLDCQDSSLDGVSPMTGLLTLEAGTDAELVEVPQVGMPCLGLEFDLVGGVATAVPGQVCRRTTDGVTFESVFTSYKLELADADDTSLAIDGLLNVDVSGAISTTCTSTVHATAAKQ